MTIEGGRLPLNSQAYLFDLDDTLINYDGLGEKTWRDACARFAPEVGISPEDLYNAISRESDVFWKDPETQRVGRLNLYATRRQLVGQAFEALHLQDKRLSDRIADEYSLLKDRSITLVGGAVEVLSALKKRRLPLALLTNGGSDIQRSKIQRFGLAAFFDCILIEGEFGVGKPDEKIFREALAKLGAPAAGTCMVGDDLERDIAGAQKVGIVTVWVDWKNAGLPQPVKIRPEYIIHSLNELV